MRNIFVTGLLLTTTVMIAQADIQKDIIHTAEGDLEMYFVGHGTLMFKFADKVIHIDPTMREYDYAKMPDADLVLITHHHGDHLDATALQQIRKSDTEVVLTEACFENLENAGKVTVMKNGERKSFAGFDIEAIPAYNIVHTRTGGEAYHPKGDGNGYVVVLGGERILIGGDTENTPELKALKDIDIAFLPMNLPYTMTPEMVADAAIAIQPGILYPYHFGNTDTDKLVELLKDQKDVEVRIRDLK